MNGPRCYCGCTMAGDSNVKIAYGLDLAGYSTGKSALARVERECGSGMVRAQILDDHPFAKRRVGKDILAVELEREAIEFILREGRLCVDAPIDLQGLMGLDSPEGTGACLSRLVGRFRKPGVPSARFTWELTSRPVDYAFGGLQPLASWIGSLVARFRNVLTTHQRGELGLRLWETYPAATLRLLKTSGRCGDTKVDLHYKDGRAKREGGSWVPAPKDDEPKSVSRARAVACMATEIGITSKDGTTINDDELDAVICALTGVAPRSDLLCGAPMEEAISCRIKKKLGKKKLGTQEARVTAPRGYVLLQRRFWSEIHLEKAEWKGDSEHG